RWACAAPLCPHCSSPLCGLLPQRVSGLSLGASPPSGIHAARNSATRSASSSGIEIAATARSFTQIENRTWWLGTRTEPSDVVISTSSRYLLTRSAAEGGSSGATGIDRNHRETLGPAGRSSSFGRRSPQPEQNRCSAGWLDPQAGQNTYRPLLVLAARPADFAVALRRRLAATDWRK